MKTQSIERTRLKRYIHRSQETCWHLTPDSHFNFENLDIAGKISCCDKAGGNYYDFFKLKEFGYGRLSISMGGVFGNGLSSARLMTTMGNLLSSRKIEPGPISKIFTDFDGFISRDTESSYVFMTLFFILVDSVKMELKCVRVGHDTAIVYDFETDSFIKLVGEIVPIKLDNSIQFHEYTYTEWMDSHIGLIGIDGILGTSNPAGKLFGKARLYQLIRDTHSQTAEEMLQTIINSINTFCGNVRLVDDFTLIIIKNKTS